MRFRRFIIISTVLSIFLGACALVVALFAYQLGMDNNPAPGTLRKFLAGFGVLLILAPLLIFAVGKLDQRFHLGQSIKKLLPIDKLPRQEKLTDPVNIAPRSRIGNFLQSGALFWSILGVIIVFVCSVWYITSGTMTQFIPYSHYYDLQADGFLSGQTSLAVLPPAEFSNLPDLWNWKARESISYIWDASYFQGKYYLYWGPVPAVLSALVKLVKPGIVEDQYLLLFFLTGLAIVFASLLHYMRKKYSPSLPAWTLTFFIMLAGLCTPVFWLANRPSVYETAIASCQFFLFLGIYAIIRGLNSAGGPWKWFLVAGFALGAAVGSRSSILFTVFFIVGLALFLLLKNNLQRRTKILSLISMFLPLILFACGLAWFNYARFGSPFETGMRYQLTGDALPDDLSQLFAPRYIIPNTYLSLLQPYQFTPQQFPFFTATYDNSWTKIIPIPENYYFAEQVTGILRTIPFLWFLVIPLVQLIQKGWRWVKEVPLTSRISSGDPIPKWLWGLLIGASFIAFVTNMLFVMTTMRYLADFTPLLLLFTSVVVMREIEYARFFKFLRVLLVIALIVSILATVIISLLINFTCSAQRFQHNNPTLYELITRF